MTDMRWCRNVTELEGNASVFVLAQKTVVAYTILSTGRNLAVQKRNSFRIMIPSRSRRKRGKEEALKPSGLSSFYHPIILRPYCGSKG